MEEEEEEEEDDEEEEEFVDVGLLLVKKAFV
jgi:hypothetical protein